MFRGREQAITNLADAQLMTTRLMMHQPYQADVDLLRARDAIEQAIAGHQTPATAMQSFIEFARARDILAAPLQSTARDNFEKMLGVRRTA